MSEMVERATRALANEIGEPIVSHATIRKDWARMTDTEIRTLRYGTRLALLAALDPEDEALVEASAIAQASTEMRDEFPNKTPAEAWLCQRERTREYWRLRARDSIAALKNAAQHRTKPKELPTMSEEDFPQIIGDLEREGISDGEQLCTGCWDASDWDVHADNDIPKGEPMYWTAPSYEYGESDRYCVRCARERAAEWEDADASPAQQERPGE